MFDASGSIQTHDFTALKNMIQKVTSQFVISSTGNIFSCITFSCMISDKVNWNINAMSGIGTNAYNSRLRPEHSA